MDTRTQVADRMQRDVVTIGSEDSLALAVQLMGWSGIRHLPVVHADRVVGMLSERDLLRRGAHDPWRPITGTVGDAMSAPVASVRSTTPLEEASAILVKREIGALAVIDDGRLEGILSATDILGHTAQCAVPPAEPTVADVMTHGVERVLADDRLVVAAAKMRRRAIRHLAVVDGAGGVIGILSDRDVTHATGPELLDVDWGSTSAYERGLLVRDAMTPDPRLARPDTPLAAAARALVEGRYGALPVVNEGGTLVGIVSPVDLLGFLAAGAR